MIDGNALNRICDIDGQWTRETTNYERVTVLTVDLKGGTTNAGVLTQFQIIEVLPVRSPKDGRVDECDIESVVRHERD